MKERKFVISLLTHTENLTGASYQTIVKMLHNMPPFRPTVETVRAIIERNFPGFVIDERWQTVKEQIADSLDYGLFSISVRLPVGDIDFTSFCVSFLEV